MATQLVASLSQVEADRDRVLSGRKEIHRILTKASPSGELGQSEAAVDSDDELAGSTFGANGNEAMFDATLQAMKDAANGDLVFANFVDFDQLYGHRRDVPGYAACLEQFDRRLPELMDLLREDDMMILTADHGNDPTWQSTDHTREQVPVLVIGPGLKTGFLGKRDTFADIGETLAAHLGRVAGPHGKSML